ncbi:heparinase II/III family protein [Paenibacillus hubeiensis]|uniref:heparinase II/III family protein n=1 Tax=Paenibacillus hubeiensis TaxID=3077330 RepID=UPI0031BA0B99
MTVHPGFAWPTDQMKQALRTARPAALKSVQSWRERVADTLHSAAFSDFRADLLAYEQKAREEAMPELSFSLYREFRDTGERKAYEQAYFERRGRVVATGLLAAFSPEPERLALLEDLIWNVCQELTWCLPAHVGAGEEARSGIQIDLFAAETAQMLAEMVVMLGDELDERVGRLVRGEIDRRIFAPLYRDNAPFGWESADHNWSAVCSGGCGIAALLLVEDEELLAAAVRRTLGSMEAFLSGYGMDGGCAEGIGYWVYGFGFYTYYADMLHLFSGGELDLLSGPKIEAIAAYPRRIHLSEGIFVNYSDSREREVLPSGLLSYWASHTGKPASLPFELPLLTGDPCRRWAHTMRNVLWSDPVWFAAEGQPANQATTVHLENLSWTISRGTVQAENGASWTAAFSVKGGHNDEPHNHNDLGHFLLHAGGETILCDPGSGEYTKAYFSPGRESIMQIGSQGHSVPVIEGTYQVSGRNAAAHTLAADVTSPGRAEIAFDLTSAYGEANNLAACFRHLKWNGPRGSEDAELVVEDRFVWKNAIDENTGGKRQALPFVVEHLISRFEPVSERGRIRWAGRRAAVTLHYDAACWDAKVEVLDAVDHDHRPLRLYRTALSLSRAGSMPESGQGAGPGSPVTECKMRFVVSPRGEGGKG